MNSKKWIIQYLEVLLDIIVMFTSYLIANWYKFGFFRTGLINHTEHYLTLFLVELVAYVVVHFVAFADDNLINRKLFPEIYNVLKMYVYVGAITVGCVYFTKTSEYFSRGQMGMTFILSTIFTVIVRQLLKRLVTKEYHRSGANEKIMLVTTSDQVERVIKKIKTTRNWDFRISNIAILDCDMVGEIVDKIEVVATADNLLQVISTAEIDSVFVHLPDGYPFKQREFVTVLNEMGKTVHLNVNEYEAKVGEHYMDFLGKYAVVTWKNKTYRVRHLLIKKLMDLLFGVAGSILIVPVWLVAFIGKIVTGNHGPVLISLVRVGKNGRRFYYYKFRTMYPDAEARKKELMDQNKMNGFMFKMDNDPRIIPIGHFLRKSSIDELPQFWNVLKGDMSLVGTRPPTVDEYKQYGIQHRKRLAMKPGITGMWQVSGRSDIVDFDEVVALDAKYIEGWTLSMDIRILWQTVMIVLTGKGAV